METPILLNIPELTARPPEWETVKAAFRDAKGSPVIQTVLLLLIGAREEARLKTETDPTLDSHQAKYWTGAANSTNELLGDIIKLLRDQGDSIDRGVKALFPQPKQHPKTAE